MKINNNYGLKTSFVKAGIRSHEHHGFVNFPIYKGSTVLYKNVKDMETSQEDSLKLNLPSYGRFGTPTCRNFEDALSKIEGGYSTICTNCGLSAITTSIMAFLKEGDHILVSDSVYTPTRNFCNSLNRFGIDTEYYNPWIGANIEKKIKENTKIVFMESPGSMTFEMQDVPAIANICKQKKITTIIDNTWATPVNFNPLKVGVDVVIHSATKYIIGHSDNLLGAIVCRDKLIYSKIRNCAIQLGQCAGNDEIYSALRGLKTITIRLKEHQKHALIISRWFLNRKETKEVFYPALNGDQGYLIWKRDFKGAAGIFSVLIDERYSKSSIDLMLNSLKLFGLGHSWGGFESLLIPVTHPSKYRLAGQWEKKGTLLRVNIGLEDTKDLIDDLEQAFKNLYKH